jgi:hypothetical protein
VDKARRARLIGGPQDGVIGELEGAVPPTLSFGENGGFTYTLVSDPRRRDKVLQYRYDPVHSPAHQLVVQADRDAIREVAEAEGITVLEVLARARERRAAAARAGNVKPADALFAEAERLGLTPEALLEQGFDLASLFPEGARS